MGQLTQSNQLLSLGLELEGYWDTQLIGTFDMDWVYGIPSPRAKKMIKRTKREVNSHIYRGRVGRDRCRRLCMLLRLAWFTWIPSPALEFLNAAGRLTGYSWVGGVFRFKEGSRREGLHGIVKLELCQQGKAIFATTRFCFFEECGLEFN